MAISIPTAFTEYDWLELVAFDSKVSSEGYTYAFEEYAPRFEDPVMKSVAADSYQLKHLHDRQKAAIDAWWDSEGDNAVDLLNDHVDESDRREKDARLWGIRCTDGHVITCDTKESRDRQVMYLNENRGKGWREPAALLQRFAPGGDWNESRLPA